MTLADAVRLQINPLYFVIFPSASGLKHPLSGWRWRRWFTKWRCPAMPVTHQPQIVWRTAISSSSKKVICKFLQDELDSERSKICNVTVFSDVRIRPVLRTRILVMKKKLHVKENPLDLFLFFLLAYFFTYLKTYLHIPSNHHSSVSSLFWAIC